MFPPKKKSGPGLAVGIMVGKPKPGGEEEDLGAPEPAEGAPKPKAPMPQAAPVPEPEMEMEQEPPAESGYGEKLLSDMKAPLIEMGMDDEAASAALASIFDRMSICLRGGQEQVTPEPAAEDYPA